MATIAINDEEDMRITKSGNLYSFERKYELRSFSMWKEIRWTSEEWMASKWILDWGLMVSSDYPTIDEIRQRQGQK